MNLGFDVAADEPTRSRRAVVEDAPTSVPMREGHDGPRRKPSTDEKKTKNRLRRQAGYVVVDRNNEPISDPYATWDEAHEDYISRLDQMGGASEAGGVKQVAGGNPGVWDENGRAVSHKESTVEDTREAAILKAMAERGRTLPELHALAAELEEVRGERRTARLTAQEVDLADSVIRDHLTPVITHTRHTAATDWLDTIAAGDEEGEEAEDEAEGQKTSSLDNRVATEASMWFGRVSAEVKADPEEFAQQAQGMARRVAGAFGARAETANRAFLDRVTFLYRQAEIGPNKVKPWDVPEPPNPDPLMEGNATSLSDAEQSGEGESSLPPEPDAQMEPQFAEDWPSTGDALVPSTRAPNVTGSLHVEAGNPYPVGTPNWFEWEDKPSGPFGGAPLDLFPEGGIPLRGDLTPEQEAWLQSRSSKTAAEDTQSGIGLFKTQAVNHAKRQGHDMGAWQENPNGGGSGDSSYWLAKCNTCGAALELMDYRAGQASNTYSGQAITNKCPGKQASKLATEGGSTCAQCGDPIERDPAGEEPRTWHHTNGEKHDHEAKPSGGESKESSFQRTASRPLYEIAREIKADWPKPYFGAVPYLQAMSQLDSINDNYGMDDAASIVTYFLSNATTWRGETAKRIKAELKQMTKGRWGSKVALFHEGEHVITPAGEGTVTEKTGTTYVVDVGGREQVFEEDELSPAGSAAIASIQRTAATCAHCGKSINPGDPGYDEAWGDVQLHDGCVDAAAAADEKRSLDAHQKWWDSMDEETRKAYEAEGFSRDKTKKGSVQHTAPGGGTHAPYSIEQRDGKWVVVNDNGEVKGTHDSEEEAREHQKALYANVPGAAEQAEKKSTKTATLTQCKSCGNEWDERQKTLGADKCPQCGSSDLKRKNASKTDQFRSAIQASLSRMGVTQ